MDAETFATSGCPSYLEWYLCYDDPARRDWIDGMERRRHPEWDPLQKQKWDFFYRPVPALIGRPQRKRIHALEAEVLGAQARLRRLKVRLTAALAVAGLAAALVALAEARLALIPVLLAAVAGLAFRIEKAKIDQQIASTQQLIASLENEIAKLRRQIPEAPEATVVEGWLGEELRAMERRCLAEILNEPVDERTLEAKIRHEAICDEVRGLLIRGWGLLQPDSMRGPMGSEKTGLHRVLEEIGPGIATWRRGSNGQPIYRVLYLQYIFLLDKNINIYGFFYDFVTRKQYGRRSETYQYNHISNYSIRETEIAQPDWVRPMDLAPALVHELFGKEVNAFALAASSGSCLRCVLVDDVVVQVMNSWLNADEKYSRLEQLSAQGEQDRERERSRLLAATFGDRAAVDAYFRRREQEDEEIRKTLRELQEREHSSLADQSMGTARKVLQQVRLRLESYAELPDREARSA